MPPRKRRKRNVNNGSDDPDELSSLDLGEEKEEEEEEVPITHVSQVDIGALERIHVDKSRLLEPDCFPCILEEPEKKRDRKFGMAVPGFPFLIIPFLEEAMAICFYPNYDEKQALMQMTRNKKERKFLGHEEGHSLDVDLDRDNNGMDPDTDITNELDVALKEDEIGSWNPARVGMSKSDRKLMYRQLFALMNRSWDELEGKRAYNLLHNETKVLTRKPWEMDKQVAQYVHPAVRAFVLFMTKKGCIPVCGGRPVWHREIGRCAISGCLWLDIQDGITVLVEVVFIKRRVFMEDNGAMWEPFAHVPNSPFNQHCLLAEYKRWMFERTYEPFQANCYGLVMVDESCHCEYVDLDNKRLDWTRAGTEAAYSRLRSDQAAPEPISE